MRTKQIVKSLFIVLASMMFLSACSNTVEDISKNITLSIVEDTVSPTEITLNIRNNSFIAYRYGKDYSLMQEVSGEWIQVPMVTDEPYVILIAYPLPSMGHREVSIDWEQWYGRLEQGTYRIGIEFTSSSESSIKEVVAIEFEINE